jgi:hypothetical protein
MGRTLLGGRGGVALFVGGKGGKEVMVRMLERKALWWDLDRAIRSAERGIDSIVKYIYVRRTAALEGNQGDFPIRRSPQTLPKLPPSKNILPSTMPHIAQCPM